MDGVTHTAEAARMTVEEFKAEVARVGALLGVSGDVKTSDDPVTDLYLCATMAGWNVARHAPTSLPPEIYVVVRLSEGQSIMARGGNLHRTWADALSDAGRNA